MSEEEPQPSSSTHQSSDQKNKSKHSYRSKDKKHKSHSKEREHKSRHSHKSSDRDKSTTNKDKRKDKDRSISKKHSSQSAKLTSDRVSSPDCKRLNNVKHGFCNGSVSPTLDCSLDSTNLINGHNSLDDNRDSNSKRKSSCSSKVKSHSGSSTTISTSKSVSSSSSNVKSRKDKSSKDSYSKSKEERKTSKRKVDDVGFGAALSCFEEISPGKKKKAKSSHKSKDRRSSKSSSSSIGDASYSSKPSTSKVSSNAILPLPNEPLPTVDALPKIDPNYKPLPRVPLPDDNFDDDLLDYPSYLPLNLPSNEHRPAPNMTQFEGLENMLRFKKERKRKMYSGNVQEFCPHTTTKIPSLFNLCISVLQENIDSLEYTGGVPFDVLKPVIELATPNQLFNLENYNPYLLEDTNLLWKQHCKKEFKNKKPDEMETYRDLYLRSVDHNDEMLKKLSEKISKETMVTARRTTQLAFEGTVAKPPKSVARAQARFGTGAPVGAPARTTKAAEITARKNAMANVQRNERAASSRTSASARKPKAPLMAKTMQFYKKHTYRR